MRVHVYALPEVCLLLAFDRVPLSDLLRLDQVCPIWAKLQRSACARRKTLVLISGDKPVDKTYFHIPFNDSFELSFNGHRPFYDLSVVERDASVILPTLWPYSAAIICPTESFDEYLASDGYEADGYFHSLYECDSNERMRLNYAHLSGRSGTYLAKLFPNVQTLVFINTSCVAEEQHFLIDLIQSSWSLKTLKVWMHTLEINGINNHPTVTLLKSINQQSTLRELTLEIIGNPEPISVESFAFIGRLKAVKLFYQMDENNVIYDSVRRFNSANLTDICFGNYEIEPKDALNLKFEIATKVRQLDAGFLLISNEQFGEFCCRFASLTTLRMDWPLFISFTLLATKLAMLKQLTHLKLDIHFQHGNFQSHEKPFALVDRVDGEESQISLPKVKILEFAIGYKHSHQEFESLSPFVFPSTEVIILSDSTQKCAICECEAQCHRLLVLSLKNKFSNPGLRIYATRGHGFVDWSNYVHSEDGDDDDEQVQKKDKGKKAKLKKKKRLIQMIAMKRKMAVMKMMAKKRKKITKRQ